MKAIPFHRSIGKKVLLLLTGTAAIAVAIACITLCAYQWRSARRTLYHQELVQAEMTSQNLAPALMFADDKATQETIASLKADSRLEKACVYNKQGMLVASFTFDNTACPENDQAVRLFTLHRLHIVQEISTQDDTLGKLYLEVSLKEVFLEIQRLLSVGFLATLVATILTFFLSSITAQWISNPIVKLMETAVKISETRNFDLRARRSSNDEVGLLIEQFNAMLDRLQQHDSELRRAHNLLEIKVKERTLTLQEEISERKLIETDLVAAKQLAEQSNLAKSNFLANMSHELRTPLNAIIGYSEILHEDAQDRDDDVAMEDLDKVLSSARHLLALIGDILDVSKIEAGRMEVHLEETPAASVLTAVLASAEMLAVKNSNRIEVHNELTNEMVNIEPLRLSQCLLNLISNACKFTTDGLITLSAAPRMQNDRAWIVWEVKDTGCGMSPEDQQQLFKRFSQVDASPARRHNGTGLGLCISQQLCQAMEGRVEVSSTLGAGSTFTIWIPTSQIEKEGSMSYGRLEQLLSTTAIETGLTR